MDVVTYALLSGKIKAVSDRVGKYDDIVGVIRVTSAATTMAAIAEKLNEVNTAGDHVVFDVSALDAGMYLVTIFIGDGYYRIADMVTGYESTGFYNDSDLLVDIIRSGGSTGNHYTFVWDMVNAAGTRLNAAAEIDTDTTNFGHFGAVNENYANPFDSIYPWSGRKLCNIDIDTYLSLGRGDRITDCITAWEDDANFRYDDPEGVWVYTPPFFGMSYILGYRRYFDVSDVKTQNNIFYPEQITGRWLGCDVSLTIDGVEKHCNIPTVGMPMANISIGNQHVYAKNFGASLIDIYTLDASILLMIVEYATMNSQTAVGQGAVSVYIENLHPAANVTDSDTITIDGLTSAQMANFVENAIIDIGTSNAGIQIGRYYINAVSTFGSSVTVTLDRSVTVTTDHFVCVHGVINVADAAIGSKSGYIGQNGRCNAYYRGETMWGNKWQYILGAYRQKDTNHIWIAEAGDTDNYDALDTTHHIDTDLVIPITESGSGGYIMTLGMADGLSCPPFCTAVGGGSTNPVGDYAYWPAASGGNTVLVLGGHANLGATAGAFYGYWNYASGNSSWYSGSRPRLLNP